LPGTAGCGDCVRTSFTLMLVMFWRALAARERHPPHHRPAGRPPASSCADSVRVTPPCSETVEPIPSDHPPSEGRTIRHLGERPLYHRTRCVVVSGAWGRPSRWSSRLAVCIAQRHRPTDGDERIFRIDRFRPAPTSEDRSRRAVRRARSAISSPASRPRARLRARAARFARTTRGAERGRDRQQTASSPPRDPPGARLARHCSRLHVARSGSPSREDAPTVGGLHFGRAPTWWASADGGARRIGGPSSPKVGWLLARLWRRSDCGPWGAVKPASYASDPSSSPGRGQLLAQYSRVVGHVLSLMVGGLYRPERHTFLSRWRHAGQRELEYAASGARARAAWRRLSLLGGRRRGEPHRRASRQPATARSDARHAHRRRAAAIAIEGPALGVGFSAKRLAFPDGARDSSVLRWTPAASPPDR